MSQTYAPAFATGRNWLGRAEDFLDARGKAAWIAAMVVGFIAFWPVGLALLAYMIWSKRMFKSSSVPNAAPSATLAAVRQATRRLTPTKPTPWRAWKRNKATLKRF